MLSARPAPYPHPPNIPIEPISPDAPTTSYPQQSKTYNTNTKSAAIEAQQQAHIMYHMKFYQQKFQIQQQAAVG